VWWKEHVMVARYRFLILLILVLSLAGCFRQASEPVEPITVPDTNPTLPVAITSTPVPLPQDTVTPAVQVITSTPVVLETQPPTEPPATVPLVQPTDTPISGSITEPQPMFTATVTPQFVTPGTGSQDTAVTTPTPVQVIATVTPLITPTDLTATVGDECIYLVQPGDTLFRIALNHGATLAEVIAVNPGIVPELIQPDDEIIIPNCGESAGEGPAATPEATGIPGQVVHVVVSGETLLAIARQYGVSSDALIAANNLANPDQLSIGQRLIIPSEDFEPGAAAPGTTVQVTPTAVLTITHVVQAGETMATIANQYDVRIIDIMQANNIADPNTITEGQELIIPPVQQ
jgi:LysM repeat protein